MPALSCLRMVSWHEDSAASIAWGHTNVHACAGHGDAYSHAEREDACLDGVGNAHGAERCAVDDVRTALAEAEST